MNHFIVLMYIIIINDMKKVILLAFFILFVSSCGTARMSVVVKSTADGTLTSNISINGSTEGGAVTPNVNVSADSSRVIIPFKNVPESH